MSLDTAIRQARIFSHPSGNLFGAAIDHFVSYGDVRTGGLANLPSALSQIMRGFPDSVTMFARTVKNLWTTYAGRSALIIQAGCFTADDRVAELVATPRDALRMGADSIAMVIPVRGENEGTHLRWLTDTVAAASIGGSGALTEAAESVESSQLRPQAKDVTTSRKTSILMTDPNQMLDLQTLTADTVIRVQHLFMGTAK
jgi:DhnA family fructose-bisphosphate aldolase class Ia